MNKPDIITSPHHHFSDREELLNLPRSDLFKPTPSKTHLTTTNSPTRSRTTKNSSNNSIVGKQKVTTESPPKESYLTKIYSPSDSVPHNRLSQSTKLDSKSPKPNRGSTFKERRSKSKVLEINTNSAVHLGQQDASHYLRMTPTSSHNCFDQKIIENRPSCTTPSKLLHSNSVKNSRSQTFENLNIKLSNPISCSHKRSSHLPQNMLSTDILQRSLSQGNNYVKITVPQRTKLREEKNSLIRNMASNSKSIERRRSSSRNKRLTPSSDIQDDPASRLSTKATTLFSDARRSFPSQKSGNVEEDYRDFSASLKSNLTFETRLSESKRFSMSKNKETSLKEVNNHYQADSKINSVEALQFQKGALVLEKGDFDSEKYRLGDIDDDRISIDSTREIIRALGNTGNLLDDKEELAHSISYSSHRESHGDLKSSEIFGNRETQRNQFIKTKTLLADHFMKEKTARSPAGDREIGKILENIMKRNSIKEIKYNPNAKFLLLRKQVQDKRAKRDTKSFESNRINQSKESKNLVARSDVNPINVNSELDLQQKKDMKLSEVFEKTKRLLRNYQDMEKGWQQEKKILLLEIQTLQNKVEKK